MKTLHTLKDPVKRMKNKASLMYDKIFANHISAKRLIARIDKDLSKHNH